jgi:predicted HTH domain antitoxin
MKETSPSEYTVTIALPAEAFLHHPWRPGRIAAELRTLWLVEQVRERRLGYGKAAELARVPKAEFVKLMGERQVSAVDYDPDELRRELDTAASLQTG